MPEKTNPSVWFVWGTGDPSGRAHYVPVVSFAGDLTEEEREAALAEAMRPLSLITTVRKALKHWHRSQRGPRNPWKSRHEEGYIL